MAEAYSDVDDGFQQIAQRVYLKYSTIGGRLASLTDYALDGSKFLKIMRESKLIGGALDAPKGLTQQQVVAKLMNADPTAATTKADYVKFHDDKATYTGMYK